MTQKSPMKSDMAKTFNSPMKKALSMNFERSKSAGLILGNVVQNKKKDEERRLKLKHTITRAMDKEREEDPDRHDCRMLKRIVKHSIDKY